MRACNCRCSSSPSRLAHFIQQQQQNLDLARKTAAICAIKIPLAYGPFLSFPFSKRRFSSSSLGPSNPQNNIKIRESFILCFPFSYSFISLRLLLLLFRPWIFPVSVRNGPSRIAWNNFIDPFNLDDEHHLIGAIKRRPVAAAVALGTGNEGPNDDERPPSMTNLGVFNDDDNELEQDGGSSSSRQ